MPLISTVLFLRIVPYCSILKSFTLCKTQNRKMSVRRGRYFENRTIDLAAGGKTTASTDKSKWTNQVVSIVDEIYKHMPPLPEHCNGGLYVGTAGVGYMFYYLANHSLFSSKRAEYLHKCSEYLQLSMAHSDHKQSRDPVASFLLGKAGVYAVTCLMYRELGDEKSSQILAEKYAQIGPVCATPGNFLGCGSDELFVGRAGYLCGALMLQKRLGRQVVQPDECINAVCSAILRSGRDYARKHKSPSPLMYSYYDTEYLGAAHGLSSILQMLLCFPQSLRWDPTGEQDVMAAVDFLLSVEQSNGNYAPAMDEVDRSRADSDQLVHWCHGAPGIVYVFGRAYKVWGDDKYLLACVRCAELTWQRGLLTKGPGICHGVAGSGYVFLLLYRLTSDPKYLHRAEKFAEFMFTSEFQSGARCPDSPYSLYEGWAGTVCFLADLLHPENSEFPFFDIF